MRSDGERKLANYQLRTLGQPVTGTKKRRSRRPTEGEEDIDFYADTLLREAIKASAESDRETESPQQTIAGARRQVIRALQIRPSDTNTLLHGIDVLVRAAAAEHRLSPRDEITFTEAVEQVLFGEGSLVLPPKDTGDIPPPPA